MKYFPQILNHNFCDSIVDLWVGQLTELKMLQLLLFILFIFITVLLLCYLLETKTSMNTHSI